MNYSCSFHSIEAENGPMSVVSLSVPPPPPPLNGGGGGGGGGGGL